MIGEEEREEEQIAEEEIAEEESEAAAAEAGGIGGTVPLDTDDPAEQPVIEGGEGEEEGYELAETDLEDDGPNYPKE